MGSYVSKFGFYEFMALLLPGTMVSQACLYFSVILKNIGVDQLDSDRYIVASVVCAFLVGLLLQELGTILDRVLCYRFLYGAHPDKAWAKVCPKCECGCHYRVVNDPNIVAKALELCGAIVPDGRNFPDKCFIIC